MVNIGQMKTGFRILWKQSAPLTFTAALMLAAFGVSLLGVFVDARMITGIPAWIKPAKFAISTAIFSGSVAWLFGYITVWRSFVRPLGWVLSSALIIEVGIIDLQAARGTTSHFNAATPLDITLFGIMGLSIAVLWFASIGVFVALCRQSFPNTAWGWALRMGLLITILGSAAGGLMLRPRPHSAPSTVGGHTVGGIDGGPGLPVLGWSREHGDLRIAHFFGLHALQIVPFIGWLILRRDVRQSSTRRQTQRVFVVSISYAGLIVLLAWQALRGEPVLAPDGLTTAALTVWLALTLSGLSFTYRLLTRS